MPYRHDVSRCLAAGIGPSGLGDAAFRAVLGETVAALDDLRAARVARSLPLLALPDKSDDLDGLDQVAARLRAEFDRVVVFGIGGSSLGGRTLCALAEPQARPLFVDNIDPHGMDRLLASLDLARTGFLVITKSGGTAETLIQMLVTLDALRRTVGREQVAPHFVLVSQPGASPLRRLAADWGIAVLDHDPGVGGRFSVLSLVGLLPALIAGLDAVAVRAGAAEVLAATLDAADPHDAAPAVGAALSIGLAREHGLATTVLMPYVDRLAPFGHWFVQLWAESLGKNETGTTPLTALGATDQHSQLQLFLDGPRDKMFSLITLDGGGLGPRVAADLAADPEIAYLRGRAVGDLMDAEQRATRDTLAAQGRPVRVFELARLDEQALGALFMHFELETIIAARLLGVDPFDQPAVEQGKVLARDYLAAGEAGAGNGGNGR